MDGNRDLQLLLLAFRDHVIDPGRLAEAAGEWSSESGTGLMEFLAVRGVIAPTELHRLEAVTIDLPAAPPGEFSVRSTLPHDGDPRANGEVTTDHPAGGDTPVTPGAAAPSGDGTIGRYTVLKLHQTGGLGQVFLARDNAVGREVALKTLRPDRAEAPGARTRFVREAQVTGQLEHPSIVPLYDMASGANPFYVMRFITGRTLAEATADYHRLRVDGKAGPLDLDALLDAFVNVCRAVAFAHSRNVLHCDLKGANIVLGRYGEVSLLDWGLARSMGGSEGSVSDSFTGEGRKRVITSPRSPVGTPAYMAPEIAAGGESSRAADIYGLGAILYVILTGRPPYSGSSATEVLKKVTTTDPAPVAEINPTAPRALVAICRKAMARNPDDRYQSAEDVATEVRRWLADEPVQAHREPWSTRAARWARRHRTAVVAAAVLLLTAAVAASAAAGLLWREEQKTRFAWERADEEKVRATENEEMALQALHYFGAYLYILETGGGTQYDEDRKRALDAGITAYNRLVVARPDDPMVQLGVARTNRYRANLARVLNQSTDAMNAYREATNHFAHLIATHPGVETYREEAILVARDYGLFLKNTGRLQEGSRVLSDSLSQFEELQRTSPNRFILERTHANLLIDRSDLEYLLGRFKESEKAAHESLEIYRRLAESPAGSVRFEQMFRAMAQSRLANAQREQGQIDEALKNHDAGVAQLEKLSPSRDAVHQLLRARTERAQTWSRIPERRERAIAELDEAIRGWERLARDYPQVSFYTHWQGMARVQRAGLNVQLNRRDAARQDATSAVQMLEALVGKYPGYPDYRCELGRAYTALGGLAAEKRDADEWYRKAREALRRAVRSSPENVHFQRALEAVEAARPPKG